MLAAWALLALASPADAGYGGFIWRGASPRVPAALYGKLPADLVWFAGHLGQFTIIVPSKQLVVLRMGVSIGGNMDFDLARDQAFDLVADLL